VLAVVVHLDETEPVEVEDELELGAHRVENLLEIRRAVDRAHHVVDRADLVEGTLEPRGLLGDPLVGRLEIVACCDEHLGASMCGVGRRPQHRGDRCGGQPCGGHRGRDLGVPAEDEHAEQRERPERRTTGEEQSRAAEQQHVADVDQRHEQRGHGVESHIAGDQAAVGSVDEQRKIGGTLAVACVCSVPMEGVRCDQRERKH
jgi:hypothetical protein